MMKTRKNNSTMVSKVKTTLHLHRDKDGKIADQYGRTLEEYTNSEGKLDLKPSGLSRGR